MWRRGNSGTTVVIALADSHGNSTVGVNPPIVPLKDGDEWRAGEASKWIWECWNDAADWAWSLKKEYRAKLYVVANGDLLDDPYYPTTKIVTKSKDILLTKIGDVIYKRWHEMADEFFVIGGTSAHSGIDFWIEELLASRLDATPDEDRGSYAWEHLKLAASGVSFDICHHAETYGWLPHTERSAATRQSNNIKTRYVDMGELVPDIALRAHGHYDADSGINTRPRTFYLYPWQLTNTSFGRRKGKNYFIRPLGLHAIICKDGRYDVKVKDYRHEGKEVWIAP